MKKKLGAILLVVALVLSFGLMPAASVGASPDPGIVGLWHFDGNALDSSGNGNDGTPQGDAGFDTGMFGQALSVDGVGDYVDVGDIGVTGDWTVEFWANPGSASVTIYYPIGLSLGSPNGKGIFVGGTYAPTAGKWGVYDGTNWILGSAVSTDTWYHFAVTKYGTTYTLYRGATYENSGTLTDIDISDLDIGRRSEGVWYFDGLIDEVRIWDEALTADQIGKYPLTVTDNIGDISGVSADSGWYDEGYDKTLTAPTTVTEDYTFYAFDYWDVDGTTVPGNPITVTMDAPHTATAHYTMVISVDKTLERCYDWELLETVIVPGDVDQSSVQSTNVLVSGRSYMFKANGTYTYWPSMTNGPGVADAEWALRPDGLWYNDLGPGGIALDILVDGSNVDWGTYASDNVYNYLYAGTGTEVSFSIWDSCDGVTPGCYGDNSGSLTVEIYEQEYYDCEALPMQTEVTFDMTITVHAWDDLTPDTDIYVEDGIGADLVVDAYTQSSGNANDFKPGNGKGKNKMSATKIGWTIYDPEVCEDYTLDIVVHTGLNPKDKQEYTSTGEHELNSGPEVHFTYDGTLYILQGPSVMVTVVGDED